ncbi:MAG: hypothetical protein WC365_01080 [Candidatus Babeliales bacterium]|jgi:ribosomal protein L11
MKIEFEREKLLQFFFALKEQADEGLLVIGNGKLSFHSSDVANVGFIAAEFKVETPETLRMAIDVQKFYSTLNALKTKTITIDFGQHCHFKGGKIERDIMSLVEAVLRAQKDPPPLEYPAIIEVQAVDYIEFLESIEKMGADEGTLPVKVFLEYDNKKFTLYSLNELREKTKSEFDMISVEKGEKSKHRSGFSFDYLLKIAKIIKKTKAEKIKISIGTNFPCQISMENEYLSMTLLVAPRIEDD